MLCFLAALRCAKSTAMAAFREISGGGGAGDDFRAVAEAVGPDAGSRPDACGGGHFEGAPELARGVTDTGVVGLLCEAYGRR